MHISFCELRAKEVVNVYNGKRLGNIIDLIIDTACAKVLGIVVPNCNAKFSIFKASSDVFIPYYNIIKIGKDVILVDLSHVDTQEYITKDKRKNKPKEQNDDDLNYVENLTTTYTKNNQPSSSSYKE